MKASNLKAVIAMSEFFTYKVSPKELIQIMQRVYDLEDTTRDRELLHSLANDLTKAIGA